MKIISIKQLHAETGRWVRAARNRPVIVTDRGEQVALLKPITEADRIRPVFSGRDLAKMPRVPVDSTRYISEDRDAR